MSKSVRVHVRSVMETAVAANEVGLVQFLSACFRRRNRGFRKAGMERCMRLSTPTGIVVLCSMIVDLRSVVTSGAGGSAAD